MRIRFIFNPCSGRNRRRPGLADSIRQFISAQAREAELTVTEGPGHATALAREAALAGHEVVAAVGGDGTMNEVAQGLLDTPAALALIPCGSGNGLALHLGLPRSPLAALRLAAGAGGRIVAVDTGVANGRPFFNAMGLGLDADVSRRFNRLARRGLPAYVRVAVAALRSRRIERCAVAAGGRREEIDALLVAVANSDQYGNHARIAPGARVNDGRLDLVAVRAGSAAQLAMLGLRLFLGNLDRSPLVRRLGGPRFVIERAASGLIHTDGETHAAGARVEVAVRPQSLRMVVPAGCTAVEPVRAAPAARFALQLP